MSDKKITRQLSIFINGNEVKNSLGGIGREIGKVKKQLKEANNPEDIKKYKKELDLLRDKYADVKEEIYDTNSALEDATSHFQNLKTGLLSGNIKQAALGFKGLASSIKSSAKAALAFVATPLGGMLTAIAAVIAGGKMWFDYNVELSKTLNLTEQLTKLTGDQLTSLRANISGVAKTFDQEYNEVLKTTNSLAKQMKITHEEALVLIEQGFVRGANANGDFLDKLKEYPVQFKNAGFSAQDFIDITTQEALGGVFSDKLIDAIKEADLALKEMNKTQVEALQNAFGEKFTKNLTTGLKTGEITTKKALQNIISKSQELGLNLQQQQQLIADIFKGAGEDAGGFSEIILQLNASFDSQNKILSDTEQATLRLSEANKEYENALSDLFDASKSGFPAMLKNIKAVSKEIFTNALRGINKMFTSIDKLKEQSAFKGQEEAVKRITENAKAFNTTFQEEAKIQIEASLKNIERIKNKIDNLGVLDSVFGSKNMYKQELSKAEAYYNELVLIAQNKSTKLNEFNKNQEALKIIDTNTETDAPQDNAKVLKLQQAKHKIFEESEQALNKIIQDLNHKRFLDQKTNTEKELLLIDKKYSDLKQKFILSEEEKTSLSKQELLKREQGLRELDAQADLEKQELKIRRQTEFREKLKAIEAENKILDENALLDEEIEKAVTDEEKALKLLEKTQFIANRELEIEREKELQKVKDFENAEQLRAAITNKFQKKKATLDSIFFKEKDKAEKESLKRDLVITGQKAGAYADMFGNISKQLGEHTAAGKAASIAQATMNTYQGITEVWAAKSILPEPFATASKVVSTGTILSSGLGAVRKISSTNTPKFFYGGNTGDKAIYNDEYGPVTGVVHDKEWVAPKFMTQSPKYAPTLQWLENERKKELGQFFNGGDASINPEESNVIDLDAPTTINQSSNENLVQVLDYLTKTLSNGIKAYTVNDYEDFIKRKQTDLEHEKILKNTRE